jgi:di/tricarboxylate transporter
VFEAEAASSEIESPDVGIIELILTPRSELIGKTIADLHFREKYDAQVLALWRDGKPLLSLSSALPLVYGDALLVQGPRQAFPLMAKDPDFLLLSEHRIAPKLSRKSVFSILALAMLMLVPILTGLPVHETAFFAAAVVVFTGAITMEQAYREIDWRVVFLLALMIPLGRAVDHVADVEHMAQGLDNLAQAVPPMGIAAVLLILGSLISQAIDSSVAVIFLGPLALSLGSNPGSSPHGLLLAVTLGSSLAFMLPTSCRSNLLVSGAGGYRSRDFMRVGFPLTVVVGLALLGVLYLINF